MNTEKPYLPVLIIDPSGRPSGIPVKRHLEESNYAIALEIDPFGENPDMQLWGDLIQGENPFLLLIRVEEKERGKGIAPEIAELITLCLFSKNYILQAGSPVIAYFDRTKDHQETLAGGSLELLISQIKRQGWATITLWPLSSLLSFQEQILEKKDRPLFLQQIDFDETLLLDHYFPDPDLLDKAIFFKRPDSGDAESLERSFSSLCASAIRQQPLFMNYLTHYLPVKKALAETATKNGILKERLRNAESTIELVRTKYKDDYEILFNWYQKEYEVLPLWYKRFGHILKVITGKRSFRSLFNDDKKNKQLK